jgi:hypothetical protein
MDRASQVLTQGVPASIPTLYRALADHGHVPHTTLHHCAHRWQSIEEKAQSQHYLTLSEDKAVLDYLLQMTHIRQPVKMKYMPAIAFCATRQQPVPDRPHKPLDKN